MKVPFILVLFNLFISVNFSLLTDQRQQNKNKFESKHYYGVCNYRSNSLLFLNGLMTRKWI